MRLRKYFHRKMKLINWYPPYLGAGIKLAEMNEERNRLVVTMKLRWYNKNLYGTHFGGSLYAMCDPFYVFILGYYLGSGYLLWDKSAKIEYLTPGKGKVRAVFEISKERLAEMKKEIDTKGKMTYRFDTEVLSEEGRLVAKVHKEVYVKIKAGMPR